MHPSDSIVGYLIHEVARAFRRRFEEVARSYELTLPQWRVLAELVRQGGQSQVKLANALDADPMTMSGILDRLAKRGLIDRQPDPADSRAKIVRLTADGEHLIASARQLGVELYDTAVAGMSPSELQAMTDGLSRMRDNLSLSTAEQKEPPK